MMKVTPNEVFVDILGFEGQYQISNTGKVKSLARQKAVSKYNPNVWIGEKIMAQHFDNGGYPYVSLLKNGKKKRQRIHKLVASHFIFGYDKNRDVNHINGNKSDNHISNLEITSRSENIKHAYRTGLHKPNRKLTEEQAFSIKYNYKGVPQRIVAQHFGIFQTTVSDIRRGRLWKHI